MTTNRTLAETLAAAQATADAILAKWNSNPENDPTRKVGRKV